MHEHDNSHTSLHASTDSMLIQENPNRFVTAAATGPDAAAVSHLWPGQVILLLNIFTRTIPVEYVGFTLLKKCCTDAPLPQI